MTNLNADLRKRLNKAREHDVFDVDIFLPNDRDVLADSFVELTPVHQAEAISQLKHSTQKKQRFVIKNILKNVNLSTYSQPVISGQRWINNSLSAKLKAPQIERIATFDEVEHVEAAHCADLESLLNDDSTWSISPESLTADQGDISWGVERINAPQMWRQGFNGEGVLCAIIDTGVNYRHPDLERQMWDRNANFPWHGFDFENRTTNPLDVNGHGTACAGIVAGSGKKGIRTGVAPGAKIMALRVGGEERNYWDALQFAIDQGVDVISMSMSWKYPSSPNYMGWRRACETVLAAGILHATSIGNQGTDTVNYPIPHNVATPGDCPPPWLHPVQNPRGGMSSPISCGAIDSADRLESLSGRGPAAWMSGPHQDYPYSLDNDTGLIKPDICAPSSGSLSCNWKYASTIDERPYRSFGGTSAATAHVAGVLCLIAGAWRIQRGGRFCTPARAQEAIERTAIPIMGQTREKENNFGSGRIDVFAAYEYGLARDHW